jgi:hypothetical protein
VVVALGETAWVPETSLIPVSGSPPGFGEIEALVAPVVLHVSVDDPPDTIVVGSAVRVAVNPGSTLMVTEALAMRCCAHSVVPAAASTKSNKTRSAAAGSIARSLAVRPFIHVPP